jgi:hypothetical protein
VQEVVGSRTDVEQVARTRAGFKSSFSVPGAGILTRSVPQFADSQAAIRFHGVATWPPQIEANHGLLVSDQT